MEKCANCDNPARGLVMIRASEDMTPSPRWEPWWTCEREHTAAQIAERARAYDPGALVLSFTHVGALAATGYAVIRETP